MANNQFETSNAHAVARLAYELWEQRGRPFGSPEVDWFAAEKALDSLRENAGASFYLPAFRIQPEEGLYSDEPADSDSSMFLETRSGPSSERL